MELTVPWEERIEEAFERKKSKYQQLVEECQERGWKAWCLPVEVGCRGFAGRSLWRSLRLLGIAGIKRKRVVADVCRDRQRQPHVFPLPPVWVKYRFPSSKVPSFGLEWHH